MEVQVKLGTPQKPRSTLRRWSEKKAQAMAGDRFVVISGCSGGGKFTLLAELAQRGHWVVEEPGRRIVAKEIEHSGSALPWVNRSEFVRRVLALARADRKAVGDLTGWTFFDSGLIDAAVAIEHLTGEPAAGTLGADRYHSRAFLTPPRPDIYKTDSERRHGFDEALDEYGRLTEVYPRFGYDVTVLPRISISQRADLGRIEMPGSAVRRGLIRAP